MLPDFLQRIPMFDVRFFIALSSRLAKISRKSALVGFSCARGVSRSAFASEACFNKTLASQVDRFPGTYPPNFNERTHAISGVLHFRSFEDSDGNAIQLQRPPSTFLCRDGRHKEAQLASTSRSSQLGQLYLRPLHRTFLTYSFFPYPMLLAHFTPKNGATLSHSAAIAPPLLMISLVSASQLL